MDDEKEKPRMTNRELFENQMKMLKGFLDRGTITEQQYRTSVSGLREKMKYNTP